MGEKEREWEGPHTASMSDEERIRLNLAERKKFPTTLAPPYGRHEARKGWSLELNNWEGYEECLA